MKHVIPAVSIVAMSLAPTESWAQDVQSVVIVVDATLSLRP